MKNIVNKWFHHLPWDYKLKNGRTYGNITVDVPAKSEVLITLDQ